MHNRKHASNDNEWNPVIHNNVDGMEIIMLNEVSQAQHDLTHMKDKNIALIEAQKSRMVVARA